MSLSHCILIAHGKPCPYCGQIMRVRSKKPTRYPDFPTRDHVVPHSVMPGMGTLMVCSKCNNDKGDLFLDEWAEHLEKIDDPRAKRVAALVTKEWSRKFAIARYSAKSRQQGAQGATP